MAHRVYLIYENSETGEWAYNGIVVRRWSQQSKRTYYVLAPGIVTALTAAAQRRWFEPEISEPQIGIVAIERCGYYHYPIGRWSVNMPFYPFDRFKTVLRLMRHMRWYAQRRLAEPDEDLFRPIALSILNALDMLGSAPLVEHRLTKRRYQIVSVGPGEPFHMYRLALAEPDGYRADRVRFVPEEDALRGVHLTEVGELAVWRPARSRRQTGDPAETHRFLINLAIRTILDGREFFFVPVADPDGPVWQLTQSLHRRPVNDHGSRRV